jgi:adenosylcobyric acid synthase
MLGAEVRDPGGVEGRPGAVVAGLGLLDVRTEFTAEKVLRLPSGSALGVPASGYEIHHGRVTVGDADPFLGGARAGSVFGTMWHGSLEGDELRRAWLREVSGLVGVPTFEPGTVGFAAAREARIDALADAVEEHVDVAAVLDLVSSGAPPLPLVRGGLA